MEPEVGAVGEVEGRWGLGFRCRAGGGGGRHGVGFLGVAWVFLGFGVGCFASVFGHVFLFRIAYVVGEGRRELVKSLDRSFFVVLG